MKYSFSKIFKTNTDSQGSVSIFRLYLMRLLFVLTFIFLGKDAWSEIFLHRGVWDPVRGVAFSFWAAYSTLMILGLRYPLKMVPLLLLQFFYKLVWLVAVAYPLWSSHQLKGAAAEGMTSVFMKAVVVDLLVIPWPYVLRNYVLKSAKTS